MNRTQENILICGIIATILCVAVFFINMIAGLILLFLICAGVGCLAYINPDLFKSNVNEDVPKKKDEIVANKKNQKNQISAPQKQDNLEAQFELLKEHINDIVKKQQNVIDDIGDRILSLNNAFLSLQEQYQVLQDKMESYSDSIPPQDIQPQEEMINVGSIEYPITYYAQTVDSYNPLGFSQKALTKEKDKSFFIIILNSEVDATYSIISDNNVQDGLVSMFNPIITDSSEYDNLPSKITSLHTTQEGVLKLCNGVWQIIKKQKIKIE